MAALDFPSSPTNGQEYTANGLTFVYSSATTSWASIIPTIQKSSENFADTDTSIMTSAAAEDRFRINVYDSSGTLLN